MSKALTVNQLIDALIVARDSHPGRGELPICLRDDNEKWSNILTDIVDASLGVDLESETGVLTLSKKKLGLVSLVGIPVPTPQVYLHLFHGRKTIEEDMDDWGENGPILGPFSYVHNTYGTCLHLGENLDECIDLQIVDGMVYYDGMLYGDWSVFNTGLPVMGEKELAVPVAFDAEKAKVPEHIKSLKPKVKVFIDMFGGTIQGVLMDNAEVDITDVVFIEDTKYATEDDDVLVEDAEGDGTDGFIYTHHQGIDIMSVGRIERVMKACEIRIKQAEEINADHDDLRRNNALGLNDE